MNTTPNATTNELVRDLACEYLSKKGIRSLDATDAEWTEACAAARLMAPLHQWSQQEAAK